MIEEVANPIKILTANLTGFIHFADYDPIDDEEMYSLGIKLFNNSDEQAETNDIYEVTPSRLACGIAGDSIKKRKFVLKCFKKDPSATGGKLAVEGCKVKIRLEAGNNDGGHDELLHYSKEDRWGKIDITEDSFTTIPKEGLEFYYEAPEASGEAVINFEVKDPSGTILKLKPHRILRVKSESILSRLAIYGLRPDITSHPNNGDYVTESLHSKLAQAIAEFRREAAATYGESLVPELETEGASLNWGGLFDVHLDWTPPHCGHRSGNQIDLSMSVFNVYDQEVRNGLRNLLDEKLRDAELEYPILSESPAGGDHWHVKD